MRPICFLGGIILSGVLASSASAAFVINEIDPDTPGSDAAEFLELKGDPNEAVNGLTLVVYNGTSTAGTAGRAKAAYDLTGNADANGYFVIGDADVAGVNFVIAAGIIENGEDAVGIYSGTSASAIAANNNASSTHPSNCPGTLIDDVIWESGADADPDWTPFTMTAVDEAGGGDAANQSIGRDPDGTGNFVLCHPTPGSANDSIPDQEVNIASPIDFGRTNAAAVTTRTVSLKNTGLGTMTVNTFQLGGGSDSEFSVIAGPDPALPAALASDESTTIVLQFSNSDVSASQVFSGSIDYSTDAPTSGSGSVPVSAEFVQIVQTASVGDVVLNEICYNPNAGTSNGGVQDYNNDGLPQSNPDEFYEIYNNTAAPINIQGWQLNTIGQQTMNAHTFIFPLGTTLAANGHAVVFNGGTPTGFPAGTAFTGDVVGDNDGAYIEISDGTTRLDAWAYGLALGTPGYTDLPTIAGGSSAGRSPDGTSTIIEFQSNSTNPAFRPTPDGVNGFSASATDWQLFN
jgi:hypothetical protein